MWHFSEGVTGMEIDNKLTPGVVWLQLLLVDPNLHSFGKYWPMFWRTFPTISTAHCLQVAKFSILNKDSNEFGGDSLEQIWSVLDSIIFDTMTIRSLNLRIFSFDRVKALEDWVLTSRNKTPHHKQNTHPRKVDGRRLGRDQTSQEYCKGEVV